MDTGPRAGLYLDLDGTLADSLTVMRAVYDRFLEHFGELGSSEGFERLNGPPLPEVVADLARTHGIGLPLGTLIEVYATMVEGAYLDVAPRAGATDLLRLARVRAMPVGVVTSNSTRVTRTWLRAVGLEAMVDVIVGAGDVERGKPDPEPYLCALERTRCRASFSLAVEDSATGTRAAVAAGIPTLFVADPIVAAPSGIAGRVASLHDVANFLST